MKTCKNCNTRLRDDAAFCPNCGNKAEENVEMGRLCPGCNMPVPAEAAFCPNCGKPQSTPEPADDGDTQIAMIGKPSEPVDDRDTQTAGADHAAPARPEPYAPSETYAQPAPYAQQGYNAQQRQYGQYDSAAPAAARTRRAPKQGESLKIPKKAIIVGAAVVVVAAVAAAVLFTFFRQGGPARPHLLYIKDNEAYFTYLSSVEPIEITERLNDTNNANLINLNAEYYRGAVILDGDVLIYPDRIDNQGYATYFYRNLSGSAARTGEAVRIDNNVQVIYGGGVALSQDGSKFFYIKGSEKRLHVYDMKSGESERIDSGVDGFSINAAGTYAVYSKDDDTIREYDLRAGEGARIDSDSWLLWVSDDISQVAYMKDDVLYTKQRGGEKVRVASGVTNWSAVVVDAGKIYYTKTDEVSHRAIDFVNDDRQGEQSADYLRDELRGTTFELENEVLYYYDGESEIKVDEGVRRTIAASRSNAAIAYTKTGDYSINLSEIRSAGQVESDVRYNRPESPELYVACNGTVSTVPVDNASGFSFDGSGTALYYIDELSDKDNYGTLMKVTFSKDVAAAPVEVTDEVNSYRFGNGNDTVFCFKHVKDGVGDIIVNGVTIATDAVIGSIYNFAGSEDIAYYVDYSDKTGDASLRLYKNGETVKVADEVSFFVADSAYNIAYLTDYNRSRQWGDANLFNSKGEKVKIDSDVSVLLWNNEDRDFGYAVWPGSYYVVAPRIEEDAGMSGSGSYPAAPAHPAEAPAPAPAAAPAIPEFLYAQNVWEYVQVNVHISYSGEKLYYSFTPSASGMYVIESSNSMDCDPNGTLYNHLGEFLTYNDDGGYSADFMMEYWLEEGETYYIEAGCYGSNTGSYTFTVYPR